MEYFESIDLPIKLTEQINDNYPGWKIIKTSEKIKENQQSSTEVFKVYIKNKNKAKKLYFINTNGSFNLKVSK